MRKYIKSRKGLTLVELVVTVAILGIVSGISITIVISAMNNYSQAAITEKEENVALLLEDYIVRNARVASNVEFIRTGHDPTEVSVTNEVSAIPSTSKVGFYIAKIDDGVETFDYDGTADPTGNYKQIRLTYQGIKKITFSIEKQKSKKMVNDDDKASYSYYLNYIIEMQSGYTLNGQTVMNNVTVPAGVVNTTSTSFVDKQTTASLLIDVQETSVYEINPSYDTAIVFS